jgi:Concanavalin A-like lectin/glucanases superfamily
VRLYVDGVQVGESTDVGLYPARLGNTPNNWIGRSQNPTDPFLTGLVDDFRIYQRGLSAKEIAKIVGTR